MKKKIIGVVSLLALVVILATALVACNPYKWNGIGGGDPSAEVSRVSIFTTSTATRVRAAAITNGVLPLNKVSFAPSSMRTAQ